MKLLGRFEENSSAQCARKCQNANTPAAYKFFTIAQHYVITGLSFRAEFITLDYVINIYPSHHLSFGHTSPQLVDHGIYELAQKMNMMIVLISPILIIYHCIVCLYIPHSTGVWYFGKTSASKSTCQCFVLSSVQKHFQICLHSNV